MSKKTAGLVEDILQGAGFDKLPPSFTIGSVSFDSMNAFLGAPDSLELVVVVELTALAAPARAEVRWLVERVARALDAAESRRPLTAVLLSEVSVPSELIDSLLRVARVVTVNGDLETASQLAPLLPLPSILSGAEDTDAIERLAPFVRGNRDAPQLRRLIEDSRRGGAAVEARLSSWLSAAFVTKDGQ